MPETEIEFKFRLDPAQAARLEAAVRRGATERTRLQARYFDTADNALARRGIALRVRKEGQSWIQTVKAVGTDSLQRWEHNVARGAGAAVPMPEPALHDGSIAGARMLEALAQTQEALAPTYETDVWRLTRLLRVPGGWVELAFDQGNVRAHAATTGKRTTAPIAELELELVRGAVPGLVQLAQRWAQRQGLWLSTVSKAEQGERLRAGVQQVAPVKAGPTHLLSNAPTGREIAQRAVASCLAHILPNASEIAAGSEDGEQVHQMRIGLRRLRTALRELAPLAPQAIDAAWLPPIVAAFRALGELRDRDEVLATAQAQLLAAGGPALTLPAAAHTASAAAVVRTPALQSVLVALMGFAADAHGAHADRPLDLMEGQALASEAAAVQPNGLSHEASLAVLQTRLAKLHAGLVRAGKRYRSLSTDQRHAVRKRLKRQRYLIEFTTELFRRKPVERYLEVLRPAQDALGDYNDEVVALQTWQGLIATDPGAWFGVGWFTARDAAHVQTCRSQLRQLRAAPRFWEG